MEKRLRSQVYDTRIDRFRVRERLAPTVWAKAAAISRTQLLRYRAAQDEPRSDTLANLVRAARTVIGKPIKASELYDLGEDEPLGERSPRVHPSPVRRVFQTRFDRLLIREGVVPSRLAASAGVTRQAVGRLRAGTDYPKVGTLAKLVRTLRRMGIDVRASDLFDVGEE